MVPWRCGAVFLVLAISLTAGAARAHDPSAWGGLFRTRDGGATWLPLNTGSFVGGAIAVAVSPTDPNVLLLATDSGLCQSPNAGRDWTVEARDVLVGAAFAVAYDTDGKRALASGASALFRLDGDGWRAIRAPAGSAPARALARGAAPGRIYLAGWTGLYRSDDWGASWADVGAGLPRDPIEALLVVPAAAPEVVYAVAGSRLWTSIDAGRQWESIVVGPPTARVDAVALEDPAARRLWALVSSRLFESEDRGRHWTPVGRPLPDSSVLTRGIAVLGPVVLLATDRGVYRSPDRGESWELRGDNLPAHLEAGPLVRDPDNPSTAYVGFAFTPYAELWRQAAEGRGAVARLSLATLAGGAALLILIALGSAAALRRLAASYYRMPAGAPGPSKNGP